MKIEIYFILATLGLLFACSPDNHGANDDKGNQEFTFSAVDLGLSVKWANANIGAWSEEDYGDYYAWGEVETKENYSWSTYKWWGSSGLSKYNNESNNRPSATFDNKTVLEPEDDAAHVVLGGSWRMPTDAEFTELRTKCAWKWTTQNGVYGIKVTGPNGKNIFLPAAGYMEEARLYDMGSQGYYVSSSLKVENPNYVWKVNFDAGGVYRGESSRPYGRPVRPVRE